MEKLKRAIFFWILVVLFFITAPVIILHSQGYRFDWNRGIFVHSGTITIKSNPQSIEVSLNNDLSASRQLDRINNSYNLSGLLPGDYAIKIFADGFQPWTKKIDVHSGVSSEFWNVLLVRNDYKKTVHEDTQGINNFYLSPQNKYIAYTKDIANGLGVSLFNISDQSTEQSFSFSGWKILDKSQLENIEWSPDENYLSIPVESLDEPKIYNYFIIDLDNLTTISLNDLLKLKTDALEKVRWDPQEKNSLFFQEGTEVFRADITEKENNTLLVAEDVSAFDLTKNNIYYVKQPNNLVFKAGLDGQSVNQITSSFPDPSAFLDRLIIYDDNRIAFIDKNKNLFIYNQGDRDRYFKKLGSEVEGMQFSDDGKKLLFWNSHEISVYFVRDWDVQPIRKEDELTNITRYGDSIDNIQWYKDYEHVIFNSGRYTKITELDPRDHRNSADMFNTTLESSFIRYNKSLEILYFTEKNDAGSTVLESIVFPESVPILGIGG